MNARLAWTGLVVAGLVGASAAPVEAQLGGLGKRVRQAKEAIAGGAPAAAAPQAAERSPYGDRVLEMTPEVLDRLERGLRAEEAERREVARRSAEAKSPEAYQQCAIEAVMSPEGQRLNEAMVAKAEALSAASGSQSALADYQRAQQAVMDYMREQCGASPDELEAERPAREQAIEVAGREASGLNEIQYAVLKERVVPLCGVAEHAGDGAVQLPGEGHDIFWVYSAVEVEALLPRCDALTALMRSAE